MKYVEKINPYNLKTKGFKVYVNCIIRDIYSSLEDYFRQLLTRQDRIDLNLYDKRIMHNSVFPFALEELRANFDQEESFTIKSMRRKGFTNFFGRMDRQFKITEFFQFLMKGFKKMDIRKFIDYIDGGYGIKYDKKKLTYLIS